MTEGRLAPLSSRPINRKSTICSTNRLFTFCGEFEATSRKARTNISVRGSLIPGLPRGNRKFSKFSQSIFSRHIPHRRRKGRRTWLPLCISIRTAKHSHRNCQREVHGRGRFSRVLDLTRLLVGFIPDFA